MKLARKTFAALALSASSAVAHPHVFIDAGVTFLFDDQGKLAAVQVMWAYDEFYSLLQLEDLELDADGDGVLSAEEQEELAGYDTNWVEGYEGDFYLSVGGNLVKLAGPTRPGAKLQDGRIVSWHIRPLLERVEIGEAEVVAKVYDPTFYTAYTVDLGISTTGREGCDTFRQAADLSKAYDYLEELLYGPGSENAGEDNFPAVGEHFADTITLTCAPSS
ncbi:MAG: DUF1007 family protein [Pseudomonadota bacterium]